MDRRDVLKLGLFSGTAFLLSSDGTHAMAASHPTGGKFDNPSPAITNPFAIELPRMTVKTPLPGGANDLLRPENGGVAPNGTVYPQIRGNDALTTYPNTLERIVAAQQRNSGNNIQFPPRLFYFLKVQQKQHAFHTDPPYNNKSTIWGYDGTYPGPTFISRYGIPILVRIFNGLYDDPKANPTVVRALPAAGTNFGNPQITTHLHNGHTASESDGNPRDFYPPSDPTDIDPLAPAYPASIKGLRFRDHHYAMFRAGLDRSQPSGPAPSKNDGDIAETLSTLWYHDHSEHFTAENVYKGLVGFHLFFDEFDSGNENDSSPRALGLPSGDFDIPLLIQDKLFNKNGELLLDKVTDNNQGFLGDRFVVNGTIQPKLTVKRRKYRFRLLNAGPSRFYQFFLVKVTSESPPKFEEQKFFHIGNDETLFTAPIKDATSVILGVAERGDIVIDFRKFADGDRLLLVNRLKMQDEGLGPEFAPGSDQIVLAPVEQGDQVLRFEVSGDAPDSRPIPDKLRDQPALPTSLQGPLTAAALKGLPNQTKFEFVQDLIDFSWKINGEPFDGDAMRYMFEQCPPEGHGPDGFVWTILNQAGQNWSHPVHIHLEEFRILLRKGAPPPVYEQCKKDVLFLRPGEEVQIFIRFRDFLGKYPIHCHNVVHEDMMMMVRYDIVGFEPRIK
jgi:FtsP/CotA-like multicopper oxidase with cupredoxin domain